MQDGGPPREIDVAWVSVPDLTVHRDHQIYEPLGAGRAALLAAPSAALRARHRADARRLRARLPDIARLAQRSCDSDAQLAAEHERVA